MTICEMCGRPANCTHHLIFGTGLRKLADEDGITMELCNDCHTSAYRICDRIHDNPMAEKFSKILGQERWEKKQIIAGRTEQQARDLFIARYGRSWI